MITFPDKAKDMFGGADGNYVFTSLSVDADLCTFSLEAAITKQMELHSQGSGLVLAVSPRGFKMALELLTLLPPGNISVAVLPCLSLDSWALIGHKGLIYSIGA